MCGIVGIFKIKQQTQELRQKALKMSQKLRHRGPDWNGIYVGGSTILAHERLSIVDPQSGGQPLYSPDRKQILAVNGEIYNHRDVRAKYAGKYDFQTGTASLPSPFMMRRKTISSLPATPSESYLYI